MMATLLEGGTPSTQDILFVRTAILQVGAR